MKTFILSQKYAQTYKLIIDKYMNNKNEIIAINTFDFKMTIDKLISENTSFKLIFFADEIISPQQLINVQFMLDKHNIKTLIITNNNGIQLDKKFQKNIVEIKNKHDDFLFSDYAQDFIKFIKGE